jgi:hypothetical protein
MLSDFQRHSGDPVVDRWVDNVLIRDLTGRPERPKARFVKRRPVSIRALHRVKPDPMFGIDRPKCLCPAWSISQTILYWQERL